MIFLQCITQVFLIFITCLFFLPICGRLHSHANGKQWFPLSLISSAPSPAPEAVAPSTNFDVRSFGAVGDGVYDDTQAFKLAWDTACQAQGSRTLLVPNGHVFMLQSTIFTGPCESGLTFEVDGTILPPDGPDSWPKYSSKKQWLVFYRINGMTMKGGGLIDGRGEKWWNLPCKPHKGTAQSGPCDSPAAIRFFMSSNLRVEGLTIRNSPKFHFRFEDCQNVHIEKLIIQSPALSPNTDGIHIENTNNVNIYNSVISNGCSSDDCVSIGAGCYDVDIRNIECGPSHGISIGSLGNYNSRACVRNITVTDSFIKHSDNGVRIKTWQGGRGSVSDVTFNNIHMDTVRNPIIIDQYYCPLKNCHNQSSAVSVSNVLYSNIRGTYDVRSMPMRFACSDSVPCTNLTLSRVELLPAQGKILAQPFCWNAYGTVPTLTTPQVLCLQQGNPLTLPQDDVVSC